MWGIVVLLVVFLIFFFLFQRLRNTKEDESLKMLSLDKKPEVGSSDITRKILSGTNTGTLQAFVFPLQAPKTGTLTLCNPSGSANPGEPDCSTGQYNLCRCNGSDCSPCKHSGYVNVFNVSNIFRIELLAAPDASRRNAASAQLVVRTTGLAFPLSATGVEDNTQPKVPTLFEETIPLPSIPFQKWTFLTVAREGRRFDIYYNDKLVVSKRTQYVVDTSIGFGPIVAGDPGLIGHVTNVQSFREKLSESQVKQNYAEKADTTGKPYTSESINVNDYLPKCEGGDCIKGPTVRPASPLLDWETPYA